MNLSDETKDALREALDAGLRSFLADMHDFSMSSAMRQAAIDHIVAQPGLFNAIGEHEVRRAGNDLLMHVASLRSLSEWLIANDHDMQLPEGIVDPDYSADILSVLAGQQMLSAPAGWFLHRAAHEQTAIYKNGDKHVPLPHADGAWVVQFQRYPNGGFLTEGRGPTMAEAWSVAVEAVRNLDTGDDA